MKNNCELRRGLVPRILLEFRVGAPHDVGNRHQDAPGLRQTRGALPLPRLVVLAKAYEILPPLALVRELEQTLVQDRVPDLLLGERRRQRLRRIEHTRTNGVDERYR